MEVIGSLVNWPSIDHSKRNVLRVPLHKRTRLEQRRKREAAAAYDLRRFGSVRFFVDFFRPGIFYGHSLAKTPHFLSNQIRVQHSEKSFWPISDKSGLAAQRAFEFMADN